MNDEALERWPDALERAIADGAIFKEVHVVRETASTQNAVRNAGAKSGLVIVAGRQTSGRGRRGRAWADTNDAGIAFSVAVEFDDHRERLPIATGIGIVQALQPGVDHRLMIKWPNDVVVVTDDDSRLRKVCGILVETHDNRAIVGVGINIAQTTWPDELADTAISLHQLGADVSRLEVLCSVLPAIDRAFGLDRTELARQFRGFDALAGRQISVESRGEMYSGVVESIDPFRGLQLLTDAGRVELGASTTTVLEVGPDQAVPGR